ncbi:MAG: TldD/PmbA family protein [Chloroflexi bacterium]|nr:TldD/PmbA family protein [Chloroflexota bacterium]
MIEVAHQILERALKAAQEAEVYYVSEHQTPAHFKSNHLKRIQTMETQGMALRIVKDGRIGFASTTNLGDVQGLVDKAVEVSAFGAPSRLELPGRANYPEVAVYDPEIERIIPDDLVHIGQSLVDSVRSHDAQVLCDATVSRSITHTAILNSRGCSLSFTQSGFEVTLEGTLIQGTDMLFVYESVHSCHPVRDTSHLVRSVREQLDQGRNVAPSVSGSLPVIFTPRGVAGAMLWPLMSGLNGRSVLQGTSPLANRLGEHIADEGFSLWDDPTIPYMPGSGMADDEGVPSRRTPLIHKGVAAGFLYDLQTAGQAGVRSTGSATRWSLGMMPLPAASVMVVDTGKLSFQNMVKDVKRGIIVETMLGAGQGNVLAGDFNANVLLGYRVENGEIIGRVKDTVVSGNVYDALANLAGIGDEAHWLGGRFYSPALYCKGISVSAKE